jgi:hypothetical protein
MMVASYTAEVSAKARTVRRRCQAVRISCGRNPLAFTFASDAQPLANRATQPARLAVNSALKYLCKPEP